MQTGNFQLVREINRRLLFRLIREGESISRADLVQLTKLSKATVSAVVDELIAAGLIMEGASNRGAVGRRPILLRINAGGPFLGAARVAAGRLETALIDPEGRIVERAETSFGGNGVGAIRALTEGLAGLDRRAHCLGRSILGVGVSVPGILNPPGDVVLCAPTLGWRDVSLPRILESTVKYPVWLGEEAKLAALAEAAVGAGSGVEVLLYLGLDTPVSAGLVRRGRLANGTHAGHLTILPDGEACWCGNNGCLETLVGADGLARRAFEMGITRPADTVPWPLWLTAQAGGGDEAARDLLAWAGRWIGVAAASLVNLCQPGMVLLGGAIGVNPDCLAAAAAEFKKRAIPPIAAPVRIRPAALGSDAGLIGAALMVLDGALGASEAPDLS